MAAAAAEPLDNQLKGEPKEVNLEEPETELDFLALFCVLAAMHFGNVVHVPGLMKYHAPLTQTSVDSNGQPLQQLTVEQMRSLVNTHHQAIAGRVASAQDMQNIGLHVRTAKKLFLTREKDRMVFKVGTQFFIGNKDKVTAKKRKNDEFRDTWLRRNKRHNTCIRDRLDKGGKQLLQSPPKNEEGVPEYLVSSQGAESSAKKMISSPARPPLNRTCPNTPSSQSVELNGRDAEVFGTAMPQTSPSQAVYQPPGQALSAEGLGDDLKPTGNPPYAGTAVDSDGLESFATFENFEELNYDGGGSAGFLVDVNLFA